MPSATSQEKTGTTPVFDLLHNKVEQLAVSRFSEQNMLSNIEKHLINILKYKLEWCY